LPFNSLEAVTDSLIIKKKFKQDPDLKFPSKSDPEPKKFIPDLHNTAVLGWYLGAPEKESLDELVHPLCSLAGLVVHPPLPHHVLVKGRAPQKPDHSTHALKLFNFYSSAQCFGPDPERIRIKWVYSTYGFSEPGSETLVCSLKLSIL
jgi:hypothetical protein